MNQGIKIQLKRSKRLNTEEKLDIINSAMHQEANKRSAEEKRLDNKEILILNKQRRFWKNKDLEIYLQKRRSEIKRAKKTWMQEKCHEM